MAQDELASPPDYTKNGIGPQELPRVIQGTGTRLISPTRPAGRIKEK
jgi:hypothetical protein